MKKATNTTDTTIGEKFAAVLLAQNEQTVNATKTTTRAAISGKGPT